MTIPCLVTQMLILGTISSFSAKVDPSTRAVTTSSSFEKNVISLMEPWFVSNVTRAVAALVHLLSFTFKEHFLHSPISVLSSVTFPLQSKQDLYSSAYWTATISPSSEALASESSVHAGWVTISPFRLFR